MWSDLGGGSTEVVDELKMASYGVGRNPRDFLWEAVPPKIPCPKRNGSCHSDPIWIVRRGLADSLAHCPFLFTTHLGWLCLLIYG